MKKKLVEIRHISTTYFAQGYVVGNLWGGGQAKYPSRTFLGRTKRTTLYNEIKAALEDGSLDGGMGFESLISATMEIVCRRTICIDTKFYVNTNTVIKKFKQ